MRLNALSPRERDVLRAIDLLLTDVIMPELNGRELMDALADLYPQMPILFMSGYTDDAVVRHGVLHAEAQDEELPEVSREARCRRPSRDPTTGSTPGDRESARFPNSRSLRRGGTQNRRALR